MYDVQGRIALKEEYIILYISLSMSGYPNLKPTAQLAYTVVVISDLANLLVCYKTISENKKQLVFHVS